MVKSGLDHKNFEGPSDVPRVSQYRLASHLSAAMVRLFNPLLNTSQDFNWLSVCHIDWVLNKKKKSEVRAFMASAMLNALHLQL